MSLIKIEKYNEVYLRVYADFSIEQELSDFFSFFVDGYRFQPKFKAKLWDGKLRLYNLQRKTLYVGLLDYVIEFANRNNYEYEFVNDVINYTDISFDDVNTFSHSLNLYGRGKPITIYDYQIDAIHTALSKNRALLISPTSSGKSLIIYNIIRHHLNNDRKIIIVVPSTQLVEQLYSDFEDYSTANGFNVEYHIQKLYSGFSKQFTKDIIITTWQSVYLESAQFFNQFDVIIGDEAHNFAAKSLTNIMDKLTNVKYRIGTTGTLNGTKVNKLVLEGVFGREYKVISTKELMDDKKVANLKISCLLLKYDNETRAALKKITYQDEMKWLCANPARNKFIRNLTISTEGNTLVLFQFISQGKTLFDYIKSKAHEDRKIFFIHGGVNTVEREAVRQLCLKEKNVIIIASYGVFSTGISIPSIENVIFASPYKSKIKVLQSIGRGLRLNEGKSHCKLFDIADDISYKKTKNITLQHAIERYKLYNQEQFKTKIIEVDLHD